MSSELFRDQKKKYPFHRKTGVRWNKSRFPRKSWKMRYTIILEKVIHTIVEFSFNHLSKTASKSWQYHTIMVLQPSAESCTQSKYCILLSSEYLAFCHHIGKERKQSTWSYSFQPSPVYGMPENPERDNYSLESPVNPLILSMLYLGAIHILKS